MNNKKYNGLRSVSNFFPKEVKNLLRKRGFFELELLKNWINIVDKKYINTSLPIKLKSGKSNNGANLVVKVDPSNAFGFQGTLEDNKNIIEEAANTLSVRKNNEYYSQGMMELGALVCKPKSPLCSQCPVVKECVSYKLNIQDQVPEAKKRNKKKKLYCSSTLILDNNENIIDKIKSKLEFNICRYSHTPESKSSVCMQIRDGEPYMVNIW